ELRANRLERRRPPDHLLEATARKRVAAFCDVPLPDERLDVADELAERVLLHVQRLVRAPDTLGRVLLVGDVNGDAARAHDGPVLVAGQPDEVAQPAPPPVERARAVLELERLAGRQPVPERANVRLVLGVDDRNPERVLLVLEPALGGVAEEL